MGATGCHLLFHATGSEVNTHEIRACQCQSSTSLSIRPPTKSVCSILRRRIVATPITALCSAKQPGKKFCYSIRRVQSDGNGVYMIGNLRYSTGGSPALILYDEKQNGSVVGSGRLYYSVRPLNGERCDWRFTRMLLFWYVFGVGLGWGFNHNSRFILRLIKMWSEGETRFTGRKKDFFF